MPLRETINSKITRLKKTISQSTAKLWQRAYRAQHRIVEFRRRYGVLAFSIALVLLISLSAYLSGSLQGILENYYKSDQAIDGIRSLILNVGSALIGAAAIVTSLVLFAMQVNIERMPHGLFRRLSTDRNLLGAFALAFLLAIAVASLSTFVEKSILSIILLTSFWAILIVLLLFLYAYQRALILINPLRQLGMLFKETKNEFQTWGRRAARAKPLLEQDETAETDPSPLDSTHDLARTTYFQLNSYWTDSAKRSIRHAMSFARRYAEQGDHEVSGAALNTIVGINAAYVETKGKTFYANNPFIDNPFSSDGFINDTLEILRQNAQSAIARRDEQQIEQTFQTMAALAQVYLGIDYSSPAASKTHAHLAAGYLSNAVQSVVPHNMADVLLEGLRLMGRSAQMILSQESPNEISTLSENIAVISSTGASNEDYRPVTLEGITQLANLTFDLLRTKDHDIHFAADEIRKDVSLVVKYFLNVTDTPISKIHSTYLGPYYSSTSTQSLRARLTDLGNAISESDSDNEDAKSVIRNLERWADGIYRTEKELLLAAVKVKSQFTFDMIHWITSVTEILCAVSNAAACDAHYRDELRRHAIWLISTLTWIPDDEETVKFIENFQMTEILFESAMNAHARGCDELAKETGKALLSWTFKGGRYETGWGILERGLYGLSVLALRDDEEQVTELKSSITSHLSKETAPTEKVCDRTARNISERAAELHRQGHWSSSIERAIDHADHEKLQPLLEEIADLLLPTADDG